MSPEEAREYNNILVDALNEDETAFSNDFYDFAPLPPTPRNMILGPYFYGRMPSSVVKVMRPQQKDICLFGKYLNWQGWDRPKLMRGWPTSGPEKWNKWLDRLSSLCDTQWREEGIYYAIMLCKSSFTCDRSLVTAGLCFWSTSTNTMKLRFGMMTPTLLDLAAMAGFRPCGGEVSALSSSKCEVDFGFTKKNKSYKVFMEANAQETGPLTHKEHTTFLMIWLCKYVFCMASAQVTLEVQPLAEALAKGHRLALGPMVLAYLYRGLYNMVSLNPMNCNTTGPIWLFQLWLQVYFPEVRPAHAIFSPNSLIGVNLLSLPLSGLKVEDYFGILYNCEGRSPDEFSVCLDREFPSYLGLKLSSLSLADNGQAAFRKSLWASILLSRDLHLGLSVGTHVNYPCGVEVYFPSATGRQLGFTQAIPLPITESCNMGTSHRAKFKTKAECNVWKHVTRDWFTSVANIIFAKLFQKWPSTIKDATSCNSVSDTGNVAREISSASPALPKKILLNKRNHSTMTGDSSSHSQAAASAKPKVVSRPKSLVIRTGRKTSMTYESSSDEDDDGIAKAPTKRPKKDPVIEDLPDLSSPGHSQEFIGFETEDQFYSPADNTVIAEVNEAVVAALANDNLGKHISPFNVVEIVKDTTQEINVGISKTVALSKTPVEVEFAQPIQDTTAITTHEMSVLQPRKKALPSEAILESLQGMRDYLATAKAATTSSYNSSLNIAAKATVQTILDKDHADLANEAQHTRLCSSIQSLLDAHFFPTEEEPTIKGFMKQLAEGIQAYNQAVMEYNDGQALIEKIQSTSHILQAHLHICHEGKGELDKLEEEQKKIEARKSTILAKIDNAVQDSRPHQVKLEKFMQQQADFQEKEDDYKTLMSTRAELWVNFKTIIQKHL
ncbi:unnamed protein product [Prunus armeniaca]|uniref:Aminotransferase-like plant mobile domain-containing protein n=1 Tax=Prunus armeniaca TaxID=36596 RepID=A0A6J5XJK9_PRUAR|nr:unnamed protein product [Prunus armeniaca]